MSATDPITPEPHRISTRLPRPLWISVLLSTLIGGTIIVIGGFIIGATYFVLHPPCFGDVMSEFTDISGNEASQRPERFWPVRLDPAEVQNVSYKYASTFDSHSAWYQIRLSPEAAATWRDCVHSREERRYEGARDHSDEGIEGVHRFVSGPPPMHRQTGTTPTWWSPPAIDFRATELMKWYRNYNSGVGRATYSGYDESTQTLWIYECSGQHDRLWSPGNVPAGQQFGSTLIIRPPPIAVVR